MNAAPVIDAGAQALAPRPNNVVHLDAESLIAKAIEHSVPVEALERLLAMRAAIRAESARGEFFAALAVFQSRIPPIAKRQTAKVTTKSGSSFNYHYADLGDIQSAIGPALADLGLSVTFDTVLENQMLKVLARVHHAAGHSETTTFAVPLERETRMAPAQAMGSALTYARRYALCAALGIVTAEDDDDGQTSQPPAATVPQTAPSGAPQTTRRPEAPTAVRVISDAQHRRLEARISELGLDRKRVKDWVLRAWHVEHLNLIPADRYTALDQRLDLWADAQRAPTTDEAADERAAIQGDAAGSAPADLSGWYADYDSAAAAE